MGPDSLVEGLGYDRAWVPDSQMIWSDCYATMALAAQATKRIKVGTGVAIPGTRIAPVTAHSVASINQIAPGRVFLGIGTGHTAMRVMRQDPIGVKDFREYLRVRRRMDHDWQDHRRPPIPALAYSDRRAGGWTQGGFRLPRRAFYGRLGAQAGGTADQRTRHR